MEKQKLDSAQKQWLLTEGKKWLEMGFIYPGALNKIFEHYGIEEKVKSVKPKKEKDPKALVKSVLYIGATLIGLGIILFIAANWDKIAASIKIVGATLLTLGFLHTGYHLKFRTTPHQNFAHAFLVLAALGIGATILLIGQIYHVQAEAYTVPLLWGALILPIAFFMRFPLILFLTGSLWLLAHIYFHQSHQAFFWAYPILLLGILVPTGIKIENKNFSYFNLGCLMISCYLATLVSAPWANLLYAVALLVLYFLNKKESLQILALIALVLWNVSFLNKFEAFPNIFYLLPLGYFFYWAYKNHSQKLMALNVFNSLFWIFTFFYQIQEKLDLPGPEATDVVLFLLAISLFVFGISKRLDTRKAWEKLINNFKTGSLALGLLMVYLLSFRFYTRQEQMLTSPLYFGAILLALFAGLVLLAPKLLHEFWHNSRRLGELVAYALVPLSIISAVILPPGHFWHVVIFNVILFWSAFVLMLKGYREKLLWVYNGGVGLFVIIIITRYFDALWQLIPRSLFFILGGIFLMLWAFFLDKKRREIMAQRST